MMIYIFQEILLKTSNIQKNITSAISSTIATSDVATVIATIATEIENNTTLSNEEKATIIDYSKHKINTTYGTVKESVTADILASNNSTITIDNNYYYYPICRSWPITACINCQSWPIDDCINNCTKECTSGCQPKLLNNRINNCTNKCTGGCLPKLVYTIIGRIDRIETIIDENNVEKKILIEIKNRTKKLFKTLFERENIQVQTYLQLTKLTSAKLVEQYNDDIYKICIEKDDEYWNNIIFPALIEFCQNFNKLIK